IRPYDPPHRAAPAHLQMKSRGDERSFFDHGRAFQALDAAQREFGDLRGEETARVVAASQRGRDALDRRARVEVEHALAEYSERCVRELRVFHVLARDLAQDRLDALELRTHGV